MDSSRGSQCYLCRSTEVVSVEGTVLQHGPDVVLPPLLPRHREGETDSGQQGQTGHICKQRKVGSAEVSHCPACL